MGYARWLPGAIADAGLALGYEPGWETRGSINFNPQCVVAHHTGAIRDVTSLLRDGRSDLPGPLCNVELRRSGECRVIAAGRANHAGRGGYRGLSGNSSALGIEASSDGKSWTAEQRDVYPVLCAVLASAIDVSREYIIRHEDWAPARKWDAGNFSTAALQAGNLQTEEDMTPDQDSILRNAYNSATQAKDIASRVEGIVRAELTNISQESGNVKAELDELRRNVRQVLVALEQTPGN